MINVYLDDIRRCPKGFVHAKNIEECLLLLREEKVDVLSLDFDLGIGQPTGLDLARIIASEQLYARRIYLHSSDLQGRLSMYQVLVEHKPEKVSVISNPMPDELLGQIAGSAAFP